MALDPRISLGLQLPTIQNASTVSNIFQNALNQAQNRATGEQQQQINEQTIQSNQQTAQVNQENRVIQLANEAGTQAAPLIQSGNVEQAQLVLTNLLGNLQSKGLPTQPTQQLLARLQSGDTEGVLQAIGGMNQVAQQRGIVSANKAQAGFTLGQGQQRFDAAGNQLASVAPKDVPADKPKVGTFRFIETPTGIAKLNTITGAQEETTLTSKEVDLARKQTLEQTTAEIKQSDTTFDRSKKIRDRHDKLSGEFVKVRSAFDRVRSSEQTAAGDIALIFNYMKMLDPGSVVREGEFATAQNAGGVDDKIFNAYNRLLTGERLNPAQRKSFESQAGKLFDISAARNKSLIRETISLGKQFDVSQSDIFGASPQSQLAPSQFTEGQTATNANGQKIIYTNGLWVPL